MPGRVVEDADGLLWLIVGDSGAQLDGVCDGGLQLAYLRRRDGSSSVGGHPWLARLAGPTRPTSGAGTTCTPRNRQALPVRTRSACSCRSSSPASRRRTGPAPEDPMHPERRPTSALCQLVREASQSLIPSGIATLEPLFTAGQLRTARVCWQLPGDRQDKGRPRTQGTHAPAEAGQGPPAHPRDARPGRRLMRSRFPRPRHAASGCTPSGSIARSHSVTVRRQRSRQ